MLRHCLLNGTCYCKRQKLTFPYCPDTFEEYTVYLFKVKHVPTMIHDLLILLAYLILPQ